MTKTARKSKGRVVYQTVFPDEFQRWLFYELSNAQHWNPDKISKKTIGARFWRFRSTDWKIEASGQTVTVTSDRRSVSIRKGLTINMVSGYIKVEGKSS